MKMKKLLLELLVAVPLGFAWNPADTQQTGFKLYWGVCGTILDKMIDVGNKLDYQGTFEVTDPVKGVCVSVVAYSALGESKRSTPLVTKIPGTPISIRQTS